MGKVLIADPSPEFCSVLTRVLTGRHEVRCCRDGVTALQLTDSFGPQVLILSLALPRLDGFGVIDVLVQRRQRPEIVVLTHFLSTYVEYCLNQRPVAYAMLKPCDMEALTHRVDELMGVPEQVEAPQFDAGDAVSALIYQFGISPLSMAGQYLQAALESYLQNPNQAITKELYPMLARKFGKTTMAVEKAIRQSITHAWERRDERIWRQYFRVMPDGMLPKPTNQQFLQTLCSCLQQQNSRVNRVI